MQWSCLKVSCIWQGAGHGAGGTAPQGLALAGPGGGSAGLGDFPNRVRSSAAIDLTAPGAFAAGAPRQQSAGNRIVTQGPAGLGAWQTEKVENWATGPQEYSD